MSGSQYIGAEDVAPVPVDAERAAVTHSHPAERTDVHAVTATCSHCGTFQAFTVPDDHDGSKIRFGCRHCDADDFTDGPEPGDLQVTVTLSPAEYEQLKAGRLKVVTVGDSGSAVETSSSG